MTSNRASNFSLILSMITVKNQKLGVYDDNNILHRQTFRINTSGIVLRSNEQYRFVEIHDLDMNYEDSKILLCETEQEVLHIFRNFKSKQTT